jgi:hypothetical protein
MIYGENDLKISKESQRNAVNLAKRDDIERSGNAEEEEEEEIVGNITRGRD